MKKFIFILLFVSIMGAGTHYGKYKFKIRTESHNTTIVTIQGYDLDNAKFRLKKRYPNCEIIRTIKGSQ